MPAPNTFQRKAILTDATQGGAEAAPKPTPLSFVALFSNRIVKIVAIVSPLFTI